MRPPSEVSGGVVFGYDCLFFGEETVRGHVTGKWTLSRGNRGRENFLWKVETQK